MAYHQLILSFSQKKLLYLPKVGVASATRHPAYSSRTYSNDIGVWILYYLRIHTCVCHLFVLSTQTLSADFYWRSTNNLKKVIKLSKPVVFNQGIQPICLPSLAPSLVNATVSGILLREWVVNSLKNEGGNGFIDISNIYHTFNWSILQSVGHAMFIAGWGAVRFLVCI